MSAVDPSGRRGAAGRGRRRVRRWVVRPLVWLLALAALAATGAVFLIESDWGGERARRLVEARLGEYLGRPVAVGRVELDLLPLGLTAHDLVLAGPEPGDPPVARVARVEIEASLAGFRRPRLTLEQVDVLEPEIYLRRGADGGTNLPQPAASEGGGGGVEVLIGTLLVRRGKLRFEDVEVPLEVAARSVWLRGGAGRADQALVAQVAAQEVEITLPDARPWTAGLNADLALGAGRLELRALRLGAPQATVRAHGEVIWDEASTGVRLAIEAGGEAGLINSLGYLDEPLTGPFRLRGDLDSAGDEWTFRGSLVSPGLDTLGYRVTGLAVDLGIDPRQLRAEILEGVYGGGAVTGLVTVELAADPPPVTLDLRFAGVALAPLLADFEVPLDGFTGGLAGELRYRFPGDDPLAGDGWAELRLSDARQRPGALPVSGAGAVLVRDGVLSTEALRLEAPGQRLTVTGTYGLAAGVGRFELALASDDLVPLIQALPLPDDPAAPWRLSGGRGTAEATVAVSADSFTLLTTADLVDVAGPLLAVDRLTGSLRLEPTAVEDLRLEAGRGGGALLVTGRVPFATPPADRSAEAETTAGPEAGGIDLTFDLVDWPAGELAALAPEAPPLAGVVSGRVVLGGDFERLTAGADLLAAPLEVAGFAFDQVAVEGAYAGDLLRLDRLSAELPAGRLAASGELDLGSGELALIAEAPALDLAAAPIAELVPGELTGSLAARLVAAGTLERPEVSLELTGSGLALAGRPLGAAGTTGVTAHWRGGRLDAEGSLLGLVTLDGGGRLDETAVELVFDLASDDLGGVLQLAAGPEAPAVTGGFAGELTVSGDPRAPQSVTAELRLPRLTAAYQGREVQALEPVVAKLVGGELTLVSFYLGDEAGGGDVFVAGSLALDGEGVPLDLDFQGNLDAVWLAALVDGVEASGRLSVLGKIGGSLELPRINGQGVVDGGQVIFAGFPHSIDDLDATVLFDPGEAVILDRLDASLAGGTLRAQGRVDLAELAGGGLSYRFQTRAEGFSLRYPEGFLLRGDADMSLTSQGDEQQLVGVIDLERAFYLEDVSVRLTQILQQALQRQRLEAGTADEVLAGIQVNVAINGPGALRVRNNLADLRGDVDLVVRGTLAAPALFGRIEAEPGGTLTYNDTEYTVDRGLITFSDPLAIDPVIDLLATAEVANYDVTLQLGGTLDRLDASFTSDPPLADLEVLSLLATGRAPTGDSVLGREGFVTGGAAESDELAGATAFLYGQAASLVSERVNALLGFDRFRVNPGIGGAVGFAVGKRLSSDLYVTVSNDPVNEIDYVVQAEWQVTDDVIVVLTQRGEEAYAVDVRWEKRF